MTPARSLAKNRYWLALFASLVAVLFLGPALVPDRPVLSHFFADTGCACGEFHEDVTGLVVFNPFRNKLPEQSASKFLEEVRSGKCSGDAAVCQYALTNHRVSEWRLENARNVGKHEVLYYRLTHIGSSEPRFRLTGEGAIEMMPSADGWKVVDYASYF